MVEDGWGWVNVESVGCNRSCGHGGEQKQGKKSPKWASRTCFTVHVQGEKKQEVGMHGNGDERASRGGLEGESMGCL